MEPLLALALVAIVGVTGWYVVRLRAERASAERRLQLERFMTTLQGGDGRTSTSPASAPAGTMTPLATAGSSLASAAGDGDGFTVDHPTALPTFADVGGMDSLKAALRDTVGLLRTHPDRAADYGIAFNGILLHGPPGTGKSHLARAIAGEFGFSLLHVSTGDLVEGVVGASARNVQRAFAVAAGHAPCLLFLDEFDSLAQRRDAAGHAEERRTVNQLLVSLEAHQGRGDVLVVAATNDLEHLDPAVLRPGRFDRHVRVDLPDLAARRAILEVQLAARPAHDTAIDLDDLARRTEGFSAADLTQLVEDAAMQAFRDAASAGDTVHITGVHLDEAMSRRGGKDRPTVEQWSWADLVLPEGVAAELQQLEALLAEPELSERLGVEPPRGVLLTGPPGTGKTTIARVLAAQARSSFYPVSAADVTSRWHGESERAVQRLFERARGNRPSIVFIDEIDAIGGTRGGGASDAGDRQLTQLLSEIDGLTSAAGILVVGATNRPDVLDPALTRGGRLSRRIEIPLPDERARHRMLVHFTRRMPTVGVDLAAVARATDGLSGADLKAVCQQAALQALVRTREAGDPEAAVEVLPEDVAGAILDHRKGVDPALR